MLPDADKVGRIIAEIAAAEIMPYFEKLGHGDVTEKGPGDLVTVADVAAEKQLSAALAALLPGSLVVGEEGVAADSSVLDVLAGETPVWLIDPIDGTANFAGGIPLFAVMVALVRDGKAMMGWIHDPVSRRTATAASGEGAWLDGTRLTVAATTGSPGARLGNRRLARLTAGKTDLVETVFNYRCAGHEYIALASGAAQFAYYNRLFPWDHAPGELLHREAGGIAARLDGTPYVPRGVETGLLLAHDEATWTALRDALVPSP
jgi:fructose-1,6-bisphosphatase/inositol monophosphatase family enzyme